MDTIEPFDPEEANKQVEGADYEMPSKLLHTFTTGNHVHYWESHGIQKTGEQLVRCKHCALGMEIEPGRNVVDGGIDWT